jgi:HD superfamily phosphodiesterase
MEDMLQIASRYVTKIFGDQLAQGITYHNLAHTKEVVNAAKTIGEKSGISKDQMEMVLLAAWFHDVGIIENYNDHEMKSAEICGEFLTKHRYPKNKIDTIVHIIRSTRIPQRPSNLLEEILCDADLSHAGKKIFSSRSQLLRIEWENMRGKRFSDIEWLITNIDFLLKNKFHTKYAKSLYDKQRKENLATLQKKKLKLS